jgi:hypothetical protein
MDPNSIELINTYALGKYLSSLKVFERASTVKLIHMGGHQLCLLYADKADLLHQYARDVILLSRQQIMFSSALI